MRTPPTTLESFLSRYDPVEVVEVLVGVLRWAAATAGLSPAEAEARVASQLAFLRRRITGDYVLDDFGFDRDLVEHVFDPLVRPLYEQWFRVRVVGGENLPTDGPALVVMNHSGTLPMDAVMVQMAIRQANPGHPRFARALGADLLFGTPFLGDIARKGGATLATGPDAAMLLKAGHVVLVCPEGFKGLGKPFSERYRLQRFGRGGFVQSAIDAGAPIVPCSVVGAEEAYPNIGNVPALARLLGLPYYPLTPTWPWFGPLGLIPLPSRWIIDFSAPIPTEGLQEQAAGDPMIVFDMANRVREVIQRRLYALLAERGGNAYF